MQSCNSWVSVCVEVKGTDQILYLVPKSQDTPIEEIMVDFKSQVKQVVKANINIKMRMVESINCFDHSGQTRKQQKYVEVRYPASYPPLSTTLSGTTFSQVLGTQATVLENFIIQRKIMGPSWITFSNYTEVTSKVSKVSWAKKEFKLSDPALVKPAETDISKPAPLLNVLSLSTKTIIFKNSNEVVAISAILHSGVSLEGSTLRRKAVKFSLIRKPTNGTIPLNFQQELEAQSKPGLSYTCCPNERALLSFLMCNFSFFFTNSECLANN